MMQWRLPLIRPGIRTCRVAAMIERLPLPLTESPAAAVHFAVPAGSGAQQTRSYSSAILVR